MESRGVDGVGFAVGTWPLNPNDSTFAQINRAEAESLDASGYAGGRHYRVE